MQFQLDNVTLNFNYSSDIEQFSEMGDSYQIEWPTSFIEKVIDQCELYADGIDWMVYLQEDLDAYLGESVVIVSDTDANILLLAVAWHSGEKVTLDVEGGEPFWLCHDLQHVKNDVTTDGDYFELYVDASAEQFTNERAIVAWNSLGLLLPQSFLNEMNNAFLERFKYNPNF